MAETAHQPSTLEKALEINLDPALYGGFAEIGAGQEVVRWFFQAGGAAGTIAKSISAYDMQVSDAIYGESDRYVSRQRLEAMLEYEQRLTHERLDDARGADTCFFTFADTVSARNYNGTNQCHAWLGIRFQGAPRDGDSSVIVHLRLHDDNNAEQQEAVGIVGVNLVHAALRQHAAPEQMIARLTDGLSPGRVEIDLVDVSGPAFDGVDNRVLALRLVQLGMTGAAMFAADGRVLQPCEALRKKPLLVMRGRFRPVTHVNMDMLQSALSTFSANTGIAAKDVLPILEISMQNLKEDSNVCLEDFVARAEVASATGCAVMISDYQQYHRLAAYLVQHTQAPIGLPLGLATLTNLFDEKYYRELDGGILEGFGRLFRRQVTLLIYPVKNRKTGAVENMDSLRFEAPLQQLYDYLVARGSLLPLQNVSTDHLDIHSPRVLEMIANGEEGWIGMVPAAVADKIVTRRLFGFGESG